MFPAIRPTAQRGSLEFGSGQMSKSELIEHAEQLAWSKHYSLVSGSPLPTQQGVAPASPKAGAASLRGQDETMTAS